MRTFSKKKKLPRLLTLCGAVAVSALLGGCGQSGVPAESFDRSDYYTRGIGSYPGDPGEDFSPSLRPDYSTYRNIALLRSAYNSSSYDYNLTAQLVTDGVISDKQPQYLDLSTQNGDIARREREWMIDQGPYSRNAVTGEDAYFLFTLNNWRKPTRYNFVAAWLMTRIRLRMDMRLFARDRMMEILGRNWLP